MKNIRYKSWLSLTCLLVLTKVLFGQAALEPWGNLAGIRIDGQLMAFESNISVVQKNWSDIKATAKEKQRPRFYRRGNTQFVVSSIDSLYFTSTVTDTGRGRAAVNLSFRANADMSLAGVYYCLVLPEAQYGHALLQTDKQKPLALSAGADSLAAYLKTPARSVRIYMPGQELSCRFEEALALIVTSGQEKAGRVFRIYIPLQTGDLTKGQSFTKSFSIAASGMINRKPVMLALNTGKPGRHFDGLGGNFRLQNPAVDPQVIDYCLSHLKVSWGRVEMPWRFWQPAIDSNPILQAKSGRINIRVVKAMEMAARLYKMGMPVILTAWAPPAWAIVGEPKFRPGADGVWGNPLDQSKTKEIYQSIADYIIYMKDQYGVEIADFSFNESDLGINIRQTGEEHRKLIKELGAYFVSRKLKTKLLLGDNSDATTFRFIDAAMADTATRPYIGAVSFHSWRGWETATLQHWADAATLLGLPLLVGEGSTDAAAWAYPAIFEEQTYALQEINLYTRLLAICAPASILQWQLTSDYSPVAGGGVYGDTTPMRPTQRFWNLKQLGDVPAGLAAMAVTSSAEDVSCAALGDNEKGIYSIQIVNNAAAREVNLSGLPATIKSLYTYTTDKNRAMEKSRPVAVVHGRARFMLQATSYTTVATY